MIHQFLQHEVSKGLSAQQRCIALTFPFASLLCVCLFLKMLVKISGLTLLNYFFFSIKSELGPVVAGHAAQDTLPVSYLPCQASPPACPSCVPFLRTPTPTFGLIYRAKDLSFGAQPQHIHSSGTEPLLTQTGPIPYSPLHHCLGV